MSKLYCSCQNYSGFLFVSQKELYFSSSLFRVEFPYNNIKKISIDTKQIRGAPSSVLVIHLQKNQSFSVVASDGELEKRKRSSKKYFFYGFHDLLGAEEMIKTNWEAARKSLTTTNDADSKDSNDAKVDTAVDLPFEKASTQNSANRAPPPPGSAPPALQRGDVDSRFSKRKPPSVPSQRSYPTPSSNARNMKRVLDSAFWSTLKGMAELLLSGGPLTFVFIFVVFVLLLFTGYHVKTFTTQHRSPKRAAAALSEKLTLVRGHAQQLDSSVSEVAYREVQAQWNRLFEHSEEWISDLEKAVSELTRQYVYAQVEMTALRQRRLERVGLDGYFSANEGQTGGKTRNPFPEFQAQDPSRVPRAQAAAAGSAAFGEGHGHGSSTSTASRSRRARSFSMHRAKDDVTRWLSWVGRVQRAITAATPWKTFPLFSRKERRGTSSSSSFRRTARAGHADTRYTESFVPGFDIAQWVTSAEAEEREMCIALEQRIFELSCEIEQLFHDFWSVLLANTAEDFASRMSKPRHFSRVPAAVALDNKRQLDFSYHPSFSGAQTLKLAFIRRYTESMLFFDPVDGNEYRRRMRAREASETFHKHIGLYSFADRASDNETAVGARLTKYVIERPVTPDAKPLTVDVLRNLLEEVVLWSKYPEEWTAHRLRTLSPTEQSQVMQLIYRRLEKSGKRHVTMVANVTEAADRYLATMRKVRPHQLDNVPLFRGMLCFSKHPQLHHTYSPPSGDDDSANASTNANNRNNNNSSSTADRDYPPKRRTETPAPRQRSWDELDIQEAEVRSLLLSAKERWMNELDIYDISVGNTPTSQVGKSRSYLLDDDLSATNPGLSDIRARLFGILERFNDNYVSAPATGLFARNGWLRRVARLFWLPTYFHLVFPAKSSTSPDTDILRRMGTLDPVAQMVSAQMVNVPWGNQQDAPLLLLETAFIQPPQLLKLRRDCKRKIIQAWLLLCFSIILLAVLYFLT